MRRLSSGDNCRDFLCVEIRLQRTVFSRCGYIVFRYEDEIMLSGSALEKVFEGNSNNRFTVGAGNLAKILQMVEVLLDENLAHLVNPQ